MILSFCSPARIELALTIRTSHRLSDVPIINKKNINDVITTDNIENTNTVEDIEEIEELVQSLWLKYSEWVWTISANTADFFVGYNQFQNLTVGGKTREGKDATNELSYLCLKTTEKVKNHQPGLSVRIHQDGPQEFLDAVTHLVSKGADFRGSFSSSGLRYKDTTCCHEVCS